ncbi:MAG: tetratricopeptide repeat protein, partial [Candidatus Aminicenantaceae bacterium]
TFYNRISLKALEQEESLDLAKGVIGTAQLPEPIKPLILERAEGNPFFIEEITRSLEEMGAFKRVEEIEAAADLDQIQIPMSIQDILMARIDRLSEEQKNSLQIAAVIGREFAARLLERIAGLEERSIGVFGDLVSLEIIYQTQFHPELAYMFKHALTHDVAYNSLLASKRKTIHARVGEVIEELYSTRPAEYYEIIAHHYEQGEVWDKAIQYLILSGEKALSNMANPSAHTFFQKAINIAGPKNLMLTPVQEYAIYQGKGNTEFNMGRIGDAEKDFFQAKEAAKKMGDQNKEAEALSMAGWSLAIGKKYEEAINIYEEAINFGQQIGNPIIEGRNLIGLGVLTMALGDIQKYLKYIEQAVEIGKRINSPLILTLSLSIRAFQFPHYGVPEEEALEYLNSMIPKLKAVQNARACVTVYLILGYSQACKGDYMASISSFQEGLRFAEETGEILVKTKALNFLGWVYGDLGWISEAKKLNEESSEAALQIGYGSEEAEAMAVANLAENAVAEGNYEQAEKYLDDLSKKAEADPGYLLNKHRWEVRQLCTLGEIFLHREENDEAMRCAHKAFEIAENTLNKRGMIKINRLIGEIYIKKRDLVKAEQRLNEALANAKEVDNPPQLWRTYSALGQLKEAQGLNREAKKQYREALQVIENVSSNLEDEKIRKIFLNSDSIIKIRDSVERL